MGSRIARAAIIAAEAAGLAVAVAAGAAAFLIWRTQAGPVSLDFAAPAVRSAANAAVFNGAVKHIENISLSKADDAGGYRLELGNLRLGGKSAETSAKIPHIEIEFYPRDFLSGRAGPRRVIIDGAELRVVRRADRKLKLDFGEPTKDRARVFQSLTGGAYFREAFEHAELRNATITFIDEATGRTWIGRDGAALVARTPEGYAAGLNSQFDIGGKIAALSFASAYDVSSDVISSKLSLQDAPVVDLVAVLFNADAEPLTSPISGEATIDLASDGAVLSSTIDLRAGAGVLSLGGWSAEIDSLAATAGFDPARNEFTVDRVAWNGAAGSGVIAGVVSIEPAASGKGVARVKFDLTGEKITINQPALLEASLPVERAAAAGTWDVKAKSLALSSLSAGLLGVSLEGKLSVQRRPGGAPAIAARATVDGALDPKTLLKAWPKGLALAARDFIEARMPRGTFSGIEAVVDIKGGAKGPLPDEALALSFRADGAEVFYAPEMTPLRNVSGRGVLRGNSFEFAAEKAMVGKVRISKGEVDIPVLAPKGEMAFFRLTAAGDAGDILAVLNEEPLAVLAETKLSPEQFSGPAVARVEISRPNLRVAPRDAYQFKGAATFDNLGVENIVGDATLSGGKGKLDLTTSGMTIAGDALVGEAPVTIEWRQRFYGEGDKTVIKIEGEADSAMADLFGVPTRQIVQGAAPFTATAVGGVDALRALDLAADLTGTALVSETLGWMKPKGKPARATAKFEFSDAETRISEMTLEGEGVSIKGSAAFAPGGAIRTLDIPEFSLDDAADISITAERTDEGALAATTTGGYLNAAEIVRNLIDNGLAGSDGKTPFGLTARIARIDFRGGASYRDAALDFRRNASHIDVLNFSAAGAEGRKLSVELKTSGDAGAEQAIEATTDDVGALLAGAFGLTSVKGGQGRLDFSFTPGDADAPRTGTLEAHDLRVTGAPLLAKIFAAGSLTGLADLVNGDGIELQNAMAAFAIEDGAVRISEARATGPSVGITGAGVYSLAGEGEIALSGAVAPAYQVNSFLGKAPVIGDLFVSRKGEGVLALSYEVDGPASEPRVTVNPLSALAPGVFRRMFEGGRIEEEAPAAE